MHRYLKTLLLSTFLLVGFFAFGFANAGDRYWIGGCSTPNWSCDDGAVTNWSLTDGGSPVSSPVGAADDLYFTSATSAPSTISANVTVDSWNTVGYTGTITHNAAVTVTIDSDDAGTNHALVLDAGTTYTLGDAA